MSSQGCPQQPISHRSGKKLHILQKLYFRQINGELRRHRRGAKLRFFNQLPPRLAFPLAHLAPLSALSAGHIFLGFTKCGQFLLSYTYSCDTDDITLQITHRYRLHWWLVVPYATLRKVAEVMLFGDQDIPEYSYDNLSITICQWPNDLSKILVYGCSLEKEADVGCLGNTSSRRCYLTITAVPSLEGCKACSAVATSYEEEEVAERWNTCIRLSCLRHGYTVHTSFDMVPPYPRFLPSVQLKYRDWVVLNAGNFLHVIRVSLETTSSGAHTGNVLLGTTNWAALYQARLQGLQQANSHHASPRLVDDHTPSDAGSGVVVEMLENGLSMRGSRAGVNNGAAVEVCCSTTMDVGEESSGSDLESDGCAAPHRDRRVLTEADREREWQILISNVPTRTSPSSSNTVNCSVVDTDSASDVELCANDTSSASDSSFCTVKDISGRFDMLKHGDLIADSRADAGGSSAPSAVVTRSQSQQRLTSPQKYDLKSSHMSPSATAAAAAAVSSSESYSCNDDSDDSTVCPTPASPARQQPRQLGANSWSPYHTHSRSNPESGRRRSRGRGSLDAALPRWHSEDGPSEPDDGSDRGGTWLRSRTLPRRSSDSTVPHVSTSPPAGNEYEFIDEIASSRHEKLSVFRRRRLADKKYEFSDENSENVPANYRTYRRQSSRHVLVSSPAVSPHDYNTRAAAAAAAAAEAASETTGSDGSAFPRSVYERLMSPASGMASPNEVLRPINPNISSPILSPREDRWSWDWDRNDKGGSQLWGSRENLTLVGESPNHSTSRTPTNWGHLVATDGSSTNEGDASVAQGLNCVVDIKRCYIEVDDELVSIITDIEDDELSSCTGYHNALPLEVHGAGYTQMHMISSSKADKLMMPCVRVRQLSLDVEQFCHDTAHQLCHQAGKRYSSCSDYNVEIVDVCSETGNIVAVASVLVQADNLPPAHPLSPHKTRSSKRPPPSPSRADPAPSMRRLFKAASTFVFSIGTKQYQVLDQQQLKEEDPFHLTCHDVCGAACEDGWWWQCGSKLARQLRALATHPTSYYGSVKVLTNQPFLRGRSLSHIMEGQHLMAVVLGPIPGVET